METASNLGELSVEKIFFMLRARIRLISGVLATSVAIAIVITFLTPKLYVASTSLNFEFNDANPLDSSGRALQSSEYLYTQMDIIKSNSVAKKVENRLTDYEVDQVYAAFDAEVTVFDSTISSIRSLLRTSVAVFTDSVSDQKMIVDEGKNDIDTIGVRSAYSRLARALGANLSVEPRVHSRVVDISYSSTDKRIAALMANTFAEAFLDTNLEMRINPARKTTVWFDEQLKVLRKKLEKSQEALTLYQQKEGIVFSDERMDTESTRLQKLSDQLIGAQQNTRNAVFAKKKLDEIIGEGTPLISYALIFDNSVVKNLKAEIRALESRLVDLSATLGRNHPKIQGLKVEIRAANARLKTEISTITDGVRNSADLAKARELDLSSELNDQKNIVLELKSQHDIIAVLDREVESANKTYNAALTQLNTTNMQSLVDQTSVSIIDPANIPSWHTSPSLPKNLAIGIFGGLLCGFGLAMFLEIFSRKIYSPNDLLFELKIPMLGHLKNS